MSRKQSEGTMDCDGRVSVTIPGDVVVDVDGDLIEEDLKTARQLVTLLTHSDRVVEKHLEVFQREFIHRINLQ